MNADLSHWKYIADRQQEEARWRQKEQQMYRQKIKNVYMNQLSNQMKANQELKKKQKSLETWQDRKLIQQSVEKQKFKISIDNVKSKLSVERQYKMEVENDYFEKKKKEHEDFLKKMEQEVENTEIQRGKMMEMRRREEETRRKDAYLREQLSNIEMTKEYKNLTDRYERNLQKHQNQELQNITIEKDLERKRFWNGLKQRSQIVDLGVHPVFENKNNKTLVERKKEQWQTYKDSIELNQKIKETQQRQRINKMVHQNQYRNQLRKQIEQNEKTNRTKSRYELEADRNTISHSTKISDNIHQQHQEEQFQRKKLLGEYLRRQAELNKREKIEENQMKEQEIKYNLGILRGQDQITSGDTYKLDINRKRQLQTVEKSFLAQQKYNTIDLTENTRLKYFAEKGINLIK